MVLWSYVVAPKPDINVFFKQKTVHLTNGAWDPFRVPGPIPNPSLDIRGESFLNGKDVRLAQPAIVVRNALKRNTLGSGLVPLVQQLGLLIESFQAQVIDFTLIIPLMSVDGQPSRGFVQQARQHPGDGCRE